MSLRQTLDLVRTVVDVVESRVESLAGPGDEQLLRESVLRFSREIAFAAAEVYAGAAEARGAWDARLEALVVDAVLRGEADDSMQSRASALGWGDVADVTFVVGSTPTVAGRRRPGGRRPAPKRPSAPGRGAGRSCSGHASSRSSAAPRDPLGVVEQVADCFGPGPIVLGPTVPHLFAAGRSARAALSGLAAAAAWPDAPRILEADAVLPERALAGDPPARRILVDRIHRPLTAKGHVPLLQTATAYLETGARSRRRRAFSSCTPTRCATGSGASATSPATTSRRRARRGRCGSPSPSAASPAASPRLPRLPAPSPLEPGGTTPRVRPRTTNHSPWRNPPNYPRRLRDIRWRGPHQ